ncbi:MAG: hypothetical protein GTN81_03490 [Proteobacteria bacterium]|nr:hypothetical protein [Pseudomonadota bacterium]
MIRVEVLLTEQEMAGGFLEAFTRRYLPEQFFYWFPLSVKAWLDLCTGGAYRNYVRSYELIQENAAHIASRLPQGEVEVISLGAGQGDKDVLILDALRTSGRHIEYIPVDASQSLLEITCSRAMEAGFSCRAIKADLTNLEHLMRLGPPKQSKKTRLMLLLGGTIGAFDPDRYLRDLCSIVNEEDFLLIDGELYAGSQTMAGYDNPLNRQFAFAPLKSVGITDSGGEVCFDMREDPSTPGLYVVSKSFVALQDLELSVAGIPVMLKSGEKIEMSGSAKYRKETFLQLICQGGKLLCEADYLTNDGRFMMALVTPQE